MKKLRRIVGWSLIILLLLLGSVAALVYLQRAQILKAVVAEANQYLQAPVSLGKAEISFAAFPRASVHFSQVFSPGWKAEPGDTLLYWEDLYLHLDLYALVQGEVQINKILIAGGQIGIYQRAGGDYNYQIWKSPGDSSGTGTVFQIDQVLLENIRLGYREAALGLRSQVEKLQIGLSTANWRKGTVDLLVNSLRLESGGRVWLKDLPLRGSLVFGLSPEGQSWQGNNLQLAELKGLNLDWSANRGYQKARLWLAKGSAELWEKLLVEQGFWPDPRLHWQGSFAGEWRMEQEAGGVMEQRASLEAADLELRWDTLPPLRGMALSAQYGRKGGDDWLEIARLEKHAKGDSLLLRAQIHNLSTPRIQARLQANLALESWLQWLPLPPVNDPEGRGRLDLSLNRRFPAWERINWQEWQGKGLQGELEMIGIAFGLEGRNQRTEGLNGALLWEQNDLEIERFFFRHGESNAYLQGRFARATGYFLGQEELVFRGRVQSQELRLSDFLSQEGSGDSVSLAFLQRLDLELQLQVDRLRYGSFRASDIQGTLRIKGGSLRGEQLRLKADGGRYLAEIWLDHRPPKTTARWQLRAEDLSLAAAFHSFDYFGQNTLTDRHLSGKAHLEMTGQANLQANLHPHLETLQVDGKLRIEEGRLQNYAPLQALSRFAEVEALQDVRFASLQNEIHIANGRIDIPEMEIKSNVMDLRISGKHHFDNRIDYLLAVKLADVLFKKRPSQLANEFDDYLALTESPTAHFIPIRISGTVAEPQVAMTGQDLRNAFRKDLQKQGQELRRILGKDSIAAKKKGSGLIFEWDDG